MLLRRFILLLVLPCACFSEPSYEGRLCDESAACPGNLTCRDGRCRLLVPSADAGLPDGQSREDAGETDDGGDRRDATPADAAQPDAARSDAALPDAALPDADGGADGGSDGGVTDASPDAGTPLCMPNETVACYSGPAGTEGQGTCRAGLMTCVGDDFGPCEGEVLPVDESCNSEDDDCDQVTDDGCPAGGISFVQPFDTDLTGWLPFGDTWGASGCGPDQVVVGFHGFYDEFLNSVGEHCDTPEVVADTSVTPHTYSLVLTPAASATARGGAVGTAYNELCPAGMVVAGISGSSGSWIDQLSFTCVDLEVVEVATPGGPPSFEIREVTGSRMLVPLQAGGTGGALFDLACPTDSVAAVRLRGANGTAKCCPDGIVTTLGLGCRELEAVIR